MIDGVISILKDDSTLTTDVGLNKAGTTVKVYPVVCPQGEEMPYIICAITGCSEKECKDIIGHPQDETFDILVYAKNYTDVSAIELRAIEILTEFSGNSSDSHISEIILQTHRDLFDNDRKAYVRVASFKGSGFFFSDIVTAFTTGFSLGFRS